MVPVVGFEPGTSCMETQYSNYCPYINEMKKSWYLNLSGFCLTLVVTPYTIPYSKRASFGLSESAIHVNGTQIFANLDFM